MLHYKASEIVQRAMTLANLQNSSFISATENRQVINDAFWALYQVMIDAGEVSMLKQIKHPVFTDGEYKLPDDFYQLYSVRDNYGNGVLRKNKNTIKNGKCYDIRLRDYVETIEVPPVPPATEPTTETGDNEQNTEVTVETGDNEQNVEPTTGTDNNEQPTDQTTQEQTTPSVETGDNEE